MTKMTDTMTISLLGRARTRSMSTVSHAHGVPHMHPMAHGHVDAQVNDACATTAPGYRTMNLATNPWPADVVIGALGGDMCFGSFAASFPADATGSTKRVHPGRLEGMT